MLILFINVNLALKRISASPAFIGRNYLFFFTRLYNSPKDKSWVSSRLVDLKLAERTYLHHIYGVILVLWLVPIIFCYTKERGIIQSIWLNNLLTSILENIDLFVAFSAFIVPPGSSSVPPFKRGMVLKCFQGGSCLSQRWIIPEPCAGLVATNH